VTSQADESELAIAPQVSVVMCTRDRPETVGQAIESVAACEGANFDLHVMDQSASDATRNIVKGAQRRFAGRRTIHYHHLKTPGLSRAYNIGVRVSDRPLIACTDDDVIVPSDWVAKITAAFDADPRLGLLYGQVLIPRALDTEVASGMIVPSLCWEERTRLFNADRNLRVWGMGANMAIRRRAFEDVGGFDELLGGGAPLRSSQDFDYCLRTYRAGWAVVLEPTVTVDHYGSRTPEQWRVTERNYGIGDGAFYWKHIRCGDVTAAWLLARKVAVIALRTVRRSLLERKLPRLTGYAKGLGVGIRESRRFDIDKQRRLYLLPADAAVEVAEANTVTAVVRDG